MGAQGPLGPQPSCLFPLIALLSLAAWSFPSASVELDLADKLTMIYGPGSPREVYSGATMNIQVKGNGYIWKTAETPSEDVLSATPSLRVRFLPS